MFLKSNEGSREIQKAEDREQDPRSRWYAAAEDKEKREVRLFSNI